MVSFLICPLQAIESSLNMICSQLQLFDNDMLNVSEKSLLLDSFLTASIRQSFAATLDTVRKKATDELAVREMQSQRKKAKKGVRFGSVEVREHEVILIFRVFLHILKMLEPARGGPCVCSFRWRSCSWTRKAQNENGEEMVPFSS